jgi:hypothetical protein
MITDRWNNGIMIRISIKPIISNTPQEKQDLIYEIILTIIVSEQEF